MYQYNFGALSERIFINNTGLFLESSSANWYILIDVYYFTEWPDVYAIPNQETSVAADVLLTNLFCHFGVLRELHRNKGQNFVFQLLREEL
jgi:hypothetical protein